MSVSIKILRNRLYPEFVGRLCRDSQVYAPVRKNKVVLYGRVHSPDEIEQNYILPRLSAKSLVFPPVEQLLSYTRVQGEVDMQPADTARFPERVVMGVRPCDARGIHLLHRVFADDPKDGVFEARMGQTTVIGLSCRESDEYCFCGNRAGDTTGSDILLTQIGNGDFLAEVITDKGMSLVGRHADLFEEPSEKPDKESWLACVPETVDAERLADSLPLLFESGIFEQQALPCIGCGTCAYVCPVCSCFDIQDESRGSRGRRVRCWDSCGFGLFTRHTSGHNPRETQGQRWRQRLMHKFSYLPENSGQTGCTGCGRCSRSCPAGISLTQIIAQIHHE